jgi:hypothetical protein
VIARNEDRAAIRAAPDSLFKAFESRDAKALAAHGTSGGEYHSQGGARIQGWEAPRPVDSPLGHGGSSIRFTSRVLSRISAPHIIEGGGHSTDVAIPRQQRHYPERMKRP